MASLPTVAEEFQAIRFRQDPGVSLGPLLFAGVGDVNDDGGADILAGAPFAGLNGGIVLFSPVTACGSSTLTPTSCGVGACAATGLLQCVGGSFLDTCSPGSPTPEVCDGIDNNCNGVIDENTCSAPPRKKKDPVKDPVKNPPKRHIKDNGE